MIARTCAFVSIAAVSGISCAAQPAQFPSALGPVVLESVASGLEHPWGLVELGDGNLLVTERPGRLRRIAPDGRVSAPIKGLPAVSAEGQGGLLGLALAPDFDRSGILFLAYAESGRGGAATAVRRARLDGDALRDAKTIFRQKHRFAASHHFGGRIVFDRDANLFLTTGDRGERLLAQRPGRHNGKVLRLTVDGDPAPGNPLLGHDDALPEIWSLGHRNIQGATLHPHSGELWTHEHGPRGGDEINIARAGRNYGWPIATHGIDYDGRDIPEARGTSAAGTEPPLHVWEHSPGISGMAFCAAEGCGAWRGDLFVGALAHTALIRLTLDGERVIGEERLLERLGERIRDVVASRDGSLYLLTDAQRGTVLRLRLLHAAAAGGRSHDAANDIQPSSSSQRE